MLVILFLQTPGLYIFRLFRKPLIETFYYRKPLIEIFYSIFFAIINVYAWLLNKLIHTYIYKCIYVCVMQRYTKYPEHQTFFKYFTMISVKT